MSVTQIYNQVQNLNRSDKIKLLQFLAAELAREEGITPLEHQENYPVWTPLDAFPAADTLLTLLESDEQSNHD